MTIYYLEHIGICITKWFTYLYILTTLNNISCYLIVSRKKQEKFCLTELFWINKNLCTWFDDNISLTVPLIFGLYVNIIYTEKCENGWRRRMVTMCKQTSKCRNANLWFSSLVHFEFPAYLLYFLNTYVSSYVQIMCAIKYHTHCVSSLNSLWILSIVHW